MVYLGTEGLAKDQAGLPHLGLRVQGRSSNGCGTKTTSTTDLDIGMVLSGSGSKWCRCSWFGNLGALATGDGTFEWQVKYR